MFLIPWVPLAASAGLSLFPWGKYALYPFKLFTTWVHECCHAVAVLLVGGKVRKITLAPDTSGLTHYQIPSGRLRHGFVASAGYLGASAVGCALYVLSAGHYAIHATLVEGSVGALMLLTTLVWIRGLFGFVTVLLLGAAMLALAHWGRPPYAETLFVFLAVQTGLHALFDIRTLFSLDGHSRSDARTMQDLFWLPAWFWALFWLSLSGGMVYWTLTCNLK